MSEPNETSAGRGATSAADHYLEQMRKLAEVGAALCCYAPGAGNPKKWPESRCDCKYLAVVNLIPETPSTALSEKTGCCEVRYAWRTLAALRGRSETTSY